MTNGASRVEQIDLIAPEDRAKWLAGEVDGLEAHLLRIERRLSQIAMAAVGILITTMTTSVTLLISGAIGG